MAAGVVLNNLLKNKTASAAQKVIIYLYLFKIVWLIMLPTSTTTKYSTGTRRA